MDFRKLPKWLKAFLRFFVLFVVIIFFLGTAFKLWASTWQTHRNDEFRFSFRYPKSWFISGYYDTQAQNEIRSVGFFIDSKELPNSPLDPVRSPGNVQVTIENSKSIIEAHQLQKDFSKLDEKKFGNKTGLVDERVSRTSSNLGGLFVFSRSLYVESDGHFYYVNTLTSSDGVGLLPQIKARFYHLIGSTVLNSFKFE